MTSSQFELTVWFTTDMGKWWTRQMDRVDGIIAKSEDARTIRVAQKHRAALISYLDEVEDALAQLRRRPSLRVKV